MIGLGWVGTNNTPYRKACGKNGFYGAAQFIHNQGWDPTAQTPPQVTKVKVKNEQWSPISEGRDELSANYTNKAGELNLVIVKDGCTNDECFFPTEVSQYINNSIEQTGMAIIRGAVDEATIQKLRNGGDVKNSHPDASEIKVKPDKKPKQLAVTDASGLSGEDGSYYCDIQKTTYLDRLQDIVVSSLKGEHVKASDYTKCILLKYSKGGENFSHRDENKGVCNFQALLILSSSDEYDGGEFYVARRMRSLEREGVDDGEISFVRTCSPKLDAGDLVIFDSGHEGGEYEHGMKRVTRGKRVAVGLLQ